MRFIKSKLFLLVLAVLVVPPILAVSCGGSQGSDPAVAPTLNVRTNPVPPAKGQQFMDVSADGSWTISVGQATSWLDVSPAEGKGSGSVTLSYAGNESSDSRSAEITVSGPGGKSSVIFTQEGAGNATTPSHGQAVAKCEWLELPQTKADDGLDFFSHEMKFNNATVRNYSYDWDYDRLIAHWVAYPLVKGHLSGVKRTDNWGLDPLLPSDRQPVLYRGFKSNGKFYARGHQLPSADRLNSYDSNSSTFYGTNMTPQDNDFNGGIWATLEAKVRGWAERSDTLYVVTGCDGDSGDYALDNNGKRVTVPQAYYKAVLRLSPNKTYTACAVYFDSVEASGAIGKYVMSVSDLEKKLGFKFFVNLDGVVGKEEAGKIKSANPKDSSQGWNW